MWHLRRCSSLALEGPDLVTLAHMGSPYCNSINACAITVINAGLLEATYTSNDTFIVEWEGVGPVEAFTCTLRESGTMIPTSSPCKICI